MVHHDEGGCGKVAFVAPKRLGNAPVRNRGKRVLREAARSCGLPRDGYNMILFATDQTASKRTPEIAQALSVLLAKAGLADER